MLGERPPHPSIFLTKLADLLATPLLFVPILCFGETVTVPERFWRGATPGVGKPGWVYTIWTPLSPSCRPRRT